MQLNKTIPDLPTDLRYRTSLSVEPPRDLRASSSLGKIILNCCDGMLILSDASFGDIVEEIEDARQKRA